MKIHLYYISYNSNHSEKNLRCSPSTQKRQAIIFIKTPICGTAVLEPENAIYMWTLS